MNKILLVHHTVIGPTYKDRVIYHIKKFYDSYRYFDVLIFTDDPDYKGFDEIKNLPNIIIEDYNRYRHEFPEFLEYEQLVEEKVSETIYRDQVFEFRSKGIVFPVNIQRFVLNYENLMDYEGMVMLDCDIVPLHDEESYNKLLSYLREMPVNSVSSNRCYYTWQDRPFVKEFLSECISELNKTDIKNTDVIDSFDNPVKMFKFESKEKIKSFLSTWNYCLLKSFTTDYKSYMVPRAWQDTCEILLGIIYILENIKVNNANEDYNNMNGFKAYTYPEDRFWDDAACKNFDISGNSKKEFVDLNYEKLKQFYKEYQQEFIYE